MKTLMDTMTGMGFTVVDACEVGREFCATFHGCNHLFHCIASPNGTWRVSSVEEELEETPETVVWGMRGHYSVSQPIYGI